MFPFDIEKQLRTDTPSVDACTARCIFKIEFPTEWERQHNHVSNAPDFCIGDTAFSTLTVNKNLPTTYHRDEGDYRQGFGVMLTLGSFTGGYLCFPAYRVAVNYQPGDVLLADVHEIHGNMKIKGSRVVCVLYAREKINECGSIEEETQKGMRSVAVYALMRNKAQWLEAEDQEPSDPREFYRAKQTLEQRAELERNHSKTSAFFTKRDKSPAEPNLGERLASFKKKKKAPKITVT